MKAWIVLLGMLACMPRAIAEPQVRVETRLLPQAPYQVGSTLRLEVDLLTTTWFTQAPQPAALHLPGALVSPPNGQADKLTESIDNTAYFGLRLTYLISPTRAGDFSIPALPFTLRMGQSSAALEVSTQPISFKVNGSPLAEATGSQLVARNVRIEQQLDQSAKPLKVGDRIIRHIQIQADDAQAMLIPPTDFIEIPGLKRYLQPPQVSTLSNGRGSNDGGQRIDSVSYVVEESGNYLLPAIELAWWDSGSQQTRSSSVPAVEFEAQSAGSFKLPFSLEADLEKLGRGRLIKLSRPFMLLIGAILLFGLGAYLARQRLREQWLRLRNWRDEKHTRWLASEAFAWRELQRALHKQALPIAELYRWQSRCQQQTDLQALAAQLPTAAAANLRKNLASHYANPHSATSVTPELLQALQQLRKSQQRQSRLQAKHFRLQSLRPWPDGVSAISDEHKAGNSRPAS